MSALFYLSNQKLHCIVDSKSMDIPCQSIDQYKKNLKEIKQRKQWKSMGAGAQFMGIDGAEDDDLSQIYPSDVVIVDENHFIYTARLQEGTSICLKSLVNLQDAEGLVLRKNDFTVFDMDYDPISRNLVLSASHDYELERHLCILPLEGNRTKELTEGECQDSNPHFNPLNREEIFYDTCGLSYTNDIAFGPKEICKLNLKTGELETVMSDHKFDFFKPQMDTNGNLYFIKRPYGSTQPLDPFSSIKNLLLAPVKIVKAIVGWLDFFTQRYTGESLKTTSGRNPAKVKQKSEEELFIEGNLIKAHQSLEKNKNAGEKFPGLIPSSWELIKLKPTGEVQVMKKGVMSFSVQEEKIYYSNGQHIISLAPDSSETLILEEKLVSKIVL